MARTLTSALGAAVLVLAATACSRHAGSAGPPDTGTLVVHAVMTVGPVNERTGRAAGEFSMTGTRVAVASPPRAIAIATTDQHGNARFALAPGRYVTRFADLARLDRRGGVPPIACGIGASSANVQVLPRRTVRAVVVCGQP